MTSPTTDAGTKRANSVRRRPRSRSTTAKFTARAPRPATTSATAPATNGITRPAEKAICAETARRTRSTRAGTTLQRADRRRPPTVAAPASPTIISAPSHVGTSRSGTPSISVAMALALISGPGIGPPPAEVGWTSCSPAAVAPTTTTRSRNADAGVVPSTSAEKGVVTTVPGGP